MLNRKNIQTYTRAMARQADLLLVKPPSVTDHIQPPLGLGFLAAHAGRHVEVQVIDMVFTGWSYKDLAACINRLKPSVVGLQCYTFDRLTVADYLRRLKDDFPGLITIVGGPHISSDPAAAKDELGDLFDYGFCGEAEYSLGRFAEILATGLEKSPAGGVLSEQALAECRKKWASLAGLITPNDINAADDFEADLDALGRPDWNQLRPELYPESQHGAFFRQFPIAPLVFTRGCPYKCTFCAAPVLSGQKIRTHSHQYIVDEIRYLQSRGVNEVHIVDDNVTFDTDWALKLFERLAAEISSISLATPNGVRLDRLNRPLLEKMKEAGLYLVSIGIESGSDRILKLMRKVSTVEKIERQVQLIRSCGINVAAFFILGFPGEKRHEIQQTVELALRLDLLRANFFCYLPFPGTASYHALEDDRQLERVDFSRLYFHQPAYSPEGISRKSLKSIQRRAFLRFYLRPAVLAANLAQIRTIRQVFYLSRRFFRWIVYKPQFLRRIFLPSSLNS